MAEAFNVHLTLALMPSTVFVSVWQNSPTEAIHHNCAHHKGGISFYIITQLSKLSWEVADGKTDFNCGTPPAHRTMDSAAIGLAGQCFVLPPVSGRCRIYADSIHSHRGRLLLETSDAGRQTRRATHILLLGILLIGHCSRRLCIRLGKYTRHRIGYQCTVSDTRRALYQFGERYARRTLPLLFQPLYERCHPYFLPVGRIVWRTSADELTLVLIKNI